MSSRGRGEGRAGEEKEGIEREGRREEEGGRGKEKNIFRTFSFFF